MLYSRTKNPNLGIFLKDLVYFMTVWYIIRPFGILYGKLASFGVIWYIFLFLVCLNQENSGNPGYIMLTKESYPPFGLATLAEE
jgi:hypothetical protein